MSDIKINPQNPSENSAKRKCCYFEKFKSCCQNFNPSRTFIATTCLLLGVALTLLMQNSSRSYGHNNDIFAEMAMMDKGMNEVFHNHRKRMNEMFEEVQKSSASKSEVIQRENDDSYFYELDFSGYKKEDIIVGVKGNVVTFTAENKRAGEERKNSYSSSSFHYSFLVPQYDTGKEPEITRLDGKIIVKLGKIK